MAVFVLSQQNRKGEIAESKALERDVDFSFAISKPLEEGQETVLYEGDYIQMTEDHFIVEVRKSRHSQQGKRFLLKIINNRLREVTNEH